jgi:hypothetical protein
MKVICEKHKGCKCYGCLHIKEHIKTQSCRQGCYYKEEDFHKHKCSPAEIRKQKLQKLNNDNKS